MAKYYNANDGAFGRQGGPFLDELQGPQGIQYVTEEELIARHARNTGQVITPDEITAPVAFEQDDEVVEEEEEVIPSLIVPDPNDSGNNQVQPSIPNFSL